jgi:hypothetical protein
MKQIIASLGFLLATSFSGYACDCFELPSHQKEFRNSVAVFIGEVLSVETPSMEMRQKLAVALQSEVGDLITLKVIRGWKGSKGKQVIWAHATHHLCQKWKFEEGKQYLIYVSKTNGVRIAADYCSRSRPLETTEKALIKELKELDRF